MTELETMERARMYLSKLANGTDPITGQELPEDTILNNVRLARCFFYTADVLRQVIENGGEIKPAKKAKRAAFSLTPAQAAEIQTSAAPLRISEFVERLNSVIDQEQVKKISTTTITNWLLKKGFLQEVVNDAGKKSRLPTEQGRGIGLSAEERQSTYGPYMAVLYDASAQGFILDNLSAILEPEE
jgi:hypothetical protein